MSISTDDLGRITQQTTVLSDDGDKLGTINQIYTSDTTGEPAWVTLKTGLFGTQESFVPLADASFEGDDIRVPVSKKAVHDAPRVDADGHLSPEEEDDLYRYYGVHNPGQPGGNGLRDDRRDDDRDDDDRDDGRRSIGDRLRGLGDHDGDDDRRDDDRVGDGPATETHGGHAAAVGAGAAGAAAMVGRDRDDDRPDVTSRRTDDDDRTSTSNDDEGVRPGERTTQLRRYVVTEKVVQTVEELPDEPSR